MSRPRKPFGTDQPGRLPATMIKVLAAEMSDPQRLRRGKQYARSGAVVDIVVEPGTVTCEIQGSRRTPYIASLDVRPGDGMPLRRDVTAACTCPDDAGPSRAGLAVCKHVVAAMFVFSDELLQEPELLDLWRDRRSVSPGAADADRLGTGAADRRDRSAPVRRRHLRLVDPDEPGDTGTSGPDAPPSDPLADLLRAPEALPPLPALPRAEQPAPTRPEVAAILREALATLRVDGD